LLLLVSALDVFGMMNDLKPEEACGDRDAQNKRSHKQAKRASLIGVARGATVGTDGSKCRLHG
jgi:hypothetical protein